MEEAPINKKTWQKGQLTIFLGISMIIVISLMAFIVNVGLFVKTKINLQNAVDAGAYAGASVQARHLTNMGYINWEMRNTLKEWMFKYYILGQVGLDATQKSNVRNNTLNPGSMSFRMAPFYNPGESGYDPNVFDFYNVPSVCIHFGSAHDICKIVSIPGLPRFNSLGLPSISAQHEAFLNELVKKKSTNCSKRSDLNFVTAVLWAYGTGNAIFQAQPEVAAHRVGAWPQALELALRMRNLEAIMNTAPVQQPVCRQGSGCQVIDTLDQFNLDMPLYERTIKAFWSSYRNLGGGDEKANIGNPDPMYSTFKMTELAPNPTVVQNNSLSGYLIPETPIGLDGVKATEKYYVDLQVLPVNFVTFYTTFVSTDEDFKNTGIKSEAKCAGTKTALPIPAYPVGFIKNPRVMTYYAIKGEMDYIGLFYPFTSERGIKLKAYSAAKPFGGRIGPRNYSPGSDGQTVQVRQHQFKSSPFISAIDTAPLEALGAFQPGFPIPTTTDFWLQPTVNPIVGGTPTSGNKAAFGIPNVLYDFAQPDHLDAQKGGGATGGVVETLTRAINEADARNNVKEKLGLYNLDQFEMFIANLGEPNGTVYTVDVIDRTLERVRAPTRYEALNYMIPTQDIGGNNPERLESIQVVDDVGGDPDKVTYRVFAPLFGNNTLYPTITTITEIMGEYITYTGSAVETFNTALQEVADSLIRNSAGSVGGDAYVQAARELYKEPLTGVEGTGGSGPGAVDPCSSLSVAQKFNIFYAGDREECGIIPVREGVTRYYNQQATEREDYRFFYTSSYVTIDPNKVANQSEVMTGYMPGPRQGSDEDGFLVRPFGSAASLPFLARRNYYSTKFFDLSKITQSKSEFGFDEKGAIFHESGTLGAAADFGNSTIINKLPLTDLSEFEKINF